MSLIDISAQKQESNVAEFHIRFVDEMAIISYQTQTK